jgi:hypothetical protein
MPSRRLAAVLSSELERYQLKSGEWGYLNSTQTSIEATCLAALALIGSYPQSCKSAMACFGNQQIENGAWTVVLPATLSRIERGDARGVEGDALLALAQWLDVPAEHLTEKPKITARATATTSTSDMIELHLRADPHLNPKTAKALATMFRIAYE